MNKHTFPVRHFSPILVPIELLRTAFATRGLHVGDRAHFVQEVPQDLLFFGQVIRQVQTEMRKTYKKRKLPASNVLKRNQSQKRGDSKRTRVERGGPNQRGFTVSEPQTAGSLPRRRTRGTKQNSRCDLAWAPRRVGGPGQRHWQDTGPRSPEHQRERERAVRVVSQSPAGNAAEDAGLSGRSEPRRTHLVCRRVGHQLVIH